MPSLRDLQRDVRAALLDGDPRAAQEIVADGLTPEARLAVYRHHVLTSLTAALEATFPVVVRLVDPRFFRFACDRYLRAHPPAGPCLFEYGATLPDFLAAFEPCRHLPWLPGVARLEWAMNAALHAPDAEPLSAEALRARPAGTLEGMEVTLHPSVTLLESPWPVDAVWRANQDGGDGGVDLDGGGVRLCVWRLGDEVVFRALGAAGFAFRRALAGGGRLAAAVAAALEAEPGADLAGLVREALDEGVLQCR
jgi:putative DNA-binding protein